MRGVFFSSTMLILVDIFPLSPIQSVFCVDFHLIAWFSHHSNLPHLLSILFLFEILVIKCQIEIVALFFWFFFLVFLKLLFFLLNFYRRHYFVLATLSLCESERIIFLSLFLPFIISSFNHPREFRTDRGETHAK